jgi:hypothetical protein
MGKELRSTPYKAGFRDETAKGLALASENSLAMQDHLHPDGFMNAQLTDVLQGNMFTPCCDTGLEQLQTDQLAEALQCRMPDVGDI